MIFETIMLICFGIAWPFSIYKSLTSRDNAGKSLPFLYAVLIGYSSGIIYKILYNYSPTLYLYILNTLMVSIDISLYYKNSLK